MNFTLIQSLWSIVILVTFIGIVLWAYSGKRKSEFDEAARLPFDDDEALDHHLLAEHLEAWRAGGLDDAAASARELGRPGASADIANAIIEEAGLSVDGPHLSHRQDRS